MDSILESLLQPRQLVALIILVKRIIILIPVKITVTIMLQLFGVVIILHLTQQIACPQCNGAHARHSLYYYRLFRSMIYSLTSVQINTFASLSYQFRWAPIVRTARRFTSQSELHLGAIIISAYFFSCLYLVEQRTLVHLLVEIFWLVAL